MKLEDIKEFELGRHCFGEILRINGKEWSEFTKEEILELILETLKNCEKDDYLIRETLRTSLESLGLNCVESSSDSCEQCGDWNNYDKYVKE